MPGEQNITIRLITLIGSVAAIHRHGYRRFVRRCHHRGVDGIEVIIQMALGAAAGPP